MPPRKRPVETNPQTSPTHPRAYFVPFQQYLAAECGMSANTIAAYKNDLSQFLTWLESQKVLSLLQVDLQLMSSYLGHLHELGLAASGRQPTFTSNDMKPPVGVSAIAVWV